MGNISTKRSEPQIDPDSILFRVRTDRNLTVEQLAKRSGVATHAIRRCEELNILPDDATLRALSQALQCKLGVFFGLLPLKPMNDPSLGSVGRLSPEEYQDIVGNDGKVISMKEFIALTHRIQQQFPQKRD
jgi:transcriptional regulator with XRE-family HTH domain